MKKGRKKEKKEKKEEISEIFKIEDGKEKIIKTHTEVEKKEEVPSEKQIKKENKILRNIIILMIGLVLMFLAILWIINYTNHFNVGGVIFEKDNTALEGKTLYRTSLPVQGKSEITGNVVTAEYNFWLRNDPRILEEEVPFYGIIRLKKENVINLNNNSFNCDGDGIIAIANLLKLYEIIGGNVIKDENAGCDEQGRYGYLNILKGNETYIDKSGPGCYNIFVKDCDILKATEKFMVEVLIETNKKVRP